MNEAPSYLKLEHLVIGYDGKPLLPAINLTIAAKQIWALVGRNGGGKSTLLNTLLGFLPIVAGKIIQSGSVKISYIPQRHEIDTNVPARVVDIILNGVDRGWSFLKPGYAESMHPLALQLLHEVDMLQTAKHSFAALSGGQKQKILMARALMSSPQLLVFDEPTASMDGVSEQHIFNLLKQLHAAHDISMVIASHELGGLAKIATHAMLVDKDTNVLLHGTAPEVFSHTAFLERFGHVHG